MRLVTLACGHTKRVATPSKVEYCRQCGRGEIVVSHGWRAKCVNCRWTRYYGGNDLGARVFGTKHALVHQHTVYVVDTGVPEDEREPIIVTGKQPTGLFGEPPF